MARSKDRPRKPNATGRNDKSGQFVMLPHRLLKSAAYASLDLVARGLLQELVMIYNGDNNGSIYLSAVDATARLGLTDKRPALRAFGHLQDRGFITLTMDSHFSVKAAVASRARCWRLTWHAWPECQTKAKRVPTQDWERYQPPNGPIGQRADTRLRTLAKHRKDTIAGRLPGVNFTPMEANMGQIGVRAGEDFTPAKLENDVILPFVVGVNFTPYIDTTRGSTGVGWWTGQSEVDLLVQQALMSWIGNSASQTALAA